MYFTNPCKTKRGTWNKVTMIRVLGTNNCFTYPYLEPTRGDSGLGVFSPTLTKYSVLCRGEEEFADYCYLDCILLVPTIDVLCLIFRTLSCFTSSHCSSSQGKSTPETILGQKDAIISHSRPTSLEAYLLLGVTWEYKKYFFHSRWTRQRWRKSEVPVKMNEQRDGSCFGSRDGVLLSHVSRLFLSSLSTRKKWERIKNRSEKTRISRRRKRERVGNIFWKLLKESQPINHIERPGNTIYTHLLLSRNTWKQDDNYSR